MNAILMMVHAWNWFNLEHYISDGSTFTLDIFKYWCWWHIIYDGEWWWCSVKCLMLMNNNVIINSVNFSVRWSIIACHQRVCWLSTSHKTKHFFNQARWQIMTKCKQHLYMILLPLRSRISPCTIYTKIEPFANCIDLIKYLIILLDMTQQI